MRSGGTYGTGLKAKATKLHAQVVRARGRCERCGASAEAVPVQCAHIVGRRYCATRCDVTNAWCLCVGCHFRTGEHADDFMALVNASIGIDAYMELKARAERGVKANDAWWQSQIDVLAPLLAEAMA